MELNSKLYNIDIALLFEPKLFHKYTEARATTRVGHAYAKYADYAHMRIMRICGCGLKISSTYSTYRGKKLVFLKGNKTIKDGDISP